jgi:hypothetical protein
MDFDVHNPEERTQINETFLRAITPGGGDYLSEGGEGREEAHKKAL